VQVVNNEGEEFSMETVLDNVSGDGLYMRMMPSVKEGASLSIEIVAHKPFGVTEERSRILVEGVVLRIEKKAGGVSGLAVAFDRVRFAWEHFLRRIPTAALSQIRPRRHSAAEPQTMKKKSRSTNSHEITRKNSVLISCGLVDRYSG
jgi:hypothetical protein